MEGKFELQFENNEYYLVDGNSNDTVATTDKVLLKEYDGYMKKLSLKNCQAIENGYDLMKLAEEYSHKYYDVKTTDWHCSYNGFFGGFQKALEILGDKKFSEHHTRLMLIDMARFTSTKEMRDAWDFDIQKFHRDRDFFIDKQIQSLQQTEWDVSFNPDEKDSEGCLILKRL